MWMTNLINQDLLFTDNQIPFKVIKIIWKWLDSSNLYEDLIEVMYKCFMGGYSPISNAKKETANSKDIHHILDLYHHFIMHEDGPKPSDKQMDSPSMIHIDIPNENHDDTERDYTYYFDSIEPIPTATELEMIGMKFKLRKQGECSSPLDVKFDKKQGILEIPMIQMTHSWKAVLQNVIDFEELTDGVGTHAIGYVYLMFCLMKNVEDMRILCRKVIIQNKIGTEDDMAKFFIDLWRKSNGFITIFPRKYLFDDINAYHQSILNFWMTSLINTFKNNPLIFVSVIGAIIFFSSELIQFIHTLKSLFKGKP